MTTLLRYLAKEIFIATALLLVALLALFALFDLIRELGELGKGNYNLSMALAFVTLSQPSHVVVIFPVAALLGTLLAISRLSAQSELTVMRASGLSLTRLAGFAVLLGLAFSALIFTFGEFVAPASEEAAKRLRLAATSSVRGGEFRSGFWVKDDLSFVNIQTVTPDTQLLNMRIYEFDHASRLTSISIVKSATYAANNRWVLKDVEKTTFENSRARIENLPTAQWNSVMTPDLLSVLRVDPNEMSIANLWAYIDHLRDNKQSSTRYELALWGKVFQPAAVIIMMLLGGWRRRPAAARDHDRTGLQFHQPVNLASDDPERLATAFVRIRAFAGVSFDRACPDRVEGVRGAIAEALSRGGSVSLM